MSLELSISCGAVLPAPKRGAAVSTPNGRLVSEQVIGRRTQSPPAPRAGRRRSSPTHTRMRRSRSPPVRGTVDSPSVGGPRTLPRSSLTARLHGRTFAEFSPAPSQEPSSTRIATWWTPLRALACHRASPASSPASTLIRPGAASGTRRDRRDPRALAQREGCNLQRERGDMPRPVSGTGRCVLSSIGYRVPVRAL